MPRYLSLAIAGAGAAFWLYTISIGLSVKDQARSDGLQWMAAFFATPVFVLVNIPALVLCFTRFQRSALFAGAFALVLYLSPFLAPAIGLF